MVVKFIGDNYDFPCANREENYGGDMNIYVLWDSHLMYQCPGSFRVPKNMKMRDFFEQIFSPDHVQHPDIEKVDWDNIVWQLSEQPWTPNIEKSFSENDVGHQSFIRFETLGLDGLHGVGN